MFKKILPMAAVICTAAMSGQVLAGNFAGPGATTVSPAAGHVNFCAALSNDVAIQLSKGVFAGYTCSAINFNAAACHETGTNKSQTVACTYSAVADTDPASLDYTDPANWAKSDEQCPAWDPNAVEQAENVTFNGRVAFQGASGGGTVSSVNLRGTACTGLIVEALTN